MVSSSSKWKCLLENSHLETRFVGAQEGFAAVAPLKAPVRHCLVFHSASEMHEAFAAVVVGMIPARLAGLVSPPPSISYFLQLVVWDKPWSRFTGSVFLLLHMLLSLISFPLLSFTQCFKSFLSHLLSLHFPVFFWDFNPEHEFVSISSYRAELSSSSISSSVMSGLKPDAFSSPLIFVLYLSPSRLNLSLTERWVTLNFGLPIWFRLSEIKFHIYPLSGLPFYALKGCIRRISHHVRKSTR